MPFPLGLCLNPNGKGIEFKLLSIIFHIAHAIFEGKQPLKRVP